MDSISLPAIAHLQLDFGRHFVVVTRVGSKTLRIMDPASGEVEKKSRAQFLAQWTGVIIVLAPAATFAPGKRDKSALVRLCQLLLPRRGMLAQSFVGIALSTLLSLSTTIFVQKIVDNVIADGNPNLLSLMGSAMLVVLCARLILNYVQGILMLRTAQQIDASIILSYYRHLIRLPQSFFDTMRIGEITSRVSDAVKIRNFLNTTFLNLLLNPLILIFSLAGMFFYSWKLALLSLGLVPLNAGLFYASNRLNRGYQRSIMERQADFEAQLVESLNAMPVVRGFRLEDHMAVRSEGKLVRLLRTVWTASRMGLGVNIAGNLVNQSYTIALLWIGTNEVLKAEMTPGQLMSCYTLAAYFTGPLVALIGMNANIQEALIAADRLYEIIDIECEKDTGSVDITGPVGDVRIERLTFAHQGRLPVLKDVSVLIPHGKITALVGESGSGKSTMLSLLQRLYTPQSGTITIGGVDIRHMRLPSLRRTITVVPQNTILLSGSVTENIAIGDPQPDFKKLTNLCHELGMLEFIESLPEGFDTQLSENGTNLSGGQRQRISILRALWTGAPILLLDEPTSALDMEAERYLVELLLKLRAQGKTIVLSSHNRATIRCADSTIYFRDGLCSVEPRRQEPFEVACAPSESSNGHVQSRLSEVAGPGDFRHQPK